VGHEVVWVLRDCLSGEVLLARGLLSGTVDDLAALLEEVRDAAPMPIAGVISERKVTASYQPGLFHCYDVPDLPRTNNDLEHFFGAARYHERRTTGRKQACPTTVVRGQVRLVASAATRQHHVCPDDLRPGDPAAWRRLRRALDQRHAARRAPLRFRRDPAAYLTALEARLLKPALPS
jgi:hypothetical protein